LAATLLGIGARQWRADGGPRQDRRDLPQKRQPEHAIRHGSGL